MPNYTFRNNNTQEEHTEFMHLSERNQFLIDNPHMEQIPVNAPGFLTNHSFKPDEGLRDILREVKRNNPGSTIETY